MQVIDMAEPPVPDTVLSTPDVPLSRLPIDVDRTIVSKRQLMTLTDRIHSRNRLLVASVALSSLMCLIVVILAGVTNHQAKETALLRTELDRLNQEPEFDINVASLDNFDPPLKWSQISTDFVLCTQDNNTPSVALTSIPVSVVQHEITTMSYRKMTAFNVVMRLPSPDAIVPVYVHRQLDVKAHERAGHRLCVEVETNKGDTYFLYCDRDLSSDCLVYRNNQETTEYEVF